MLKKLKNDKKGFTLVELIVVLVILAILAALLVPALTGYIDRAKEKAVIADTRSVVMAAQTLEDEVYANATTSATGDYTFAAGTVGDKSGATIEAVKTLSEVKGTINSIVADQATGKIKTVSYTLKNKTCVYTAANTTEYAIQ